jgi:hypothetical protein
VSGGCDSSYLVQDGGYGGRAAVHFDNTWNSPIATSNIYSPTPDATQTYVDNKEYDDIHRPSC